MRCLLEEFRKGTARRPAVIVGFREHIFTGSVSSLANYMALQELSFVTLGQRVLNNPLRVRMHYGHPDLFDKVCMCAGFFLLFCVWCVAVCVRSKARAFCVPFIFFRILRVGVCDSMWALWCVDSGERRRMQRAALCATSTCR